MQKLEKVISSRTKVRFQDSDPFNHLNNGKYIDYMMNAREDQIQEHYGLDLFDLARNKGIGWVVATNQISYINSAVTMEDLYMDSQLMNFSEKHLDVEIRMWNKNRTQLKAFLWVRFVQVNLKNQKVGTHSEELMELFGQVVLPVEQANFDARNQYWRRNAVQQEPVLV
ncbi:thioesterase family protein [Aureispira sp. CCB-QB1]|uniref:acyl-CoA thioesterase n=1 Tax=Aureispira sp. CCB-QB1 TaxID=1313421 RepID=UPI0006989783|nr:acyl-CoA thioesterase [Aureispira sp. CCB-QB1]